MACNPESRDLEETQKSLKELCQDFPEDDSKVTFWLLQKIDSEQEQALLDAAAQPRHASGNACIKLCYFIDQCRKSPSGVLRGVAFSSAVSISLFSFYIEWTEKNQHRSMRQVVEQLATLLISNPDHVSATSIRRMLLARAVSITGHQAAQPLVKPAFKALECLLTKRAVSAEEITNCNHGKGVSNTTSTIGSFVSSIFGWMCFPDISPSAGKFLVAFFHDIKSRSSLQDTSVAHARSEARLNDQNLVEASHEYGKLWQRWILDGLARYPECLENIKNYLFPPLFKLDRQGSLEFLRLLSQDVSVNSNENGGLNPDFFLLLAAMEVGKKFGLVIDADAKVPENSNSISLPEGLIGRLLSHSSNIIRSSAFSVLISTNISTRPFSVTTLDLFKENLATLYADTDAKFRNEVLSNTKHMIERIRDSNVVLARAEMSIAGSNAHGGDRGSSTMRLPGSSSLSLQQGFLKWFRYFLSHELVPTASYQRHITSLKALSILLLAGTKSKHRTIDDSELLVSSYFDTLFIRLLLDLLADPFEDVRASATAILKLAPLSAFAINATSNDHTETQQSNNLQLLLDFRSRVEVASKVTGRADLADAVARANELLYTFSSEAIKMESLKSMVLKLESMVSVAEADIATAVADVSIHEQFAALKAVWEIVDPIKLKESPDIMIDLQHRMFTCCERIWLVVSEILCDDSPEGHLPASTYQRKEVTTKMFLSYSFRAVHESSNLMSSVVKKGKILDSKGETILAPIEFVRASKLTFAQLSTLRHRGAFSTVSATFAMCCKVSSMYQPHSPGENLLLQEWYAGALDCIMEQLSTTRRSAGIPALMTGILSAQTESPSLSEVIGKLKEIAKMKTEFSALDQINLPQVHATNCLKEIFQSSTLGKLADGHISDCLVIARDNLDSKIWAIRNCGLLLLRSLIDCLFGTSESKAVTDAGWDGRSIRINYNRYAGLPELILKLIEDGVSPREVADDDYSTQSVFPALDIIRRAGPPPGFTDRIFDAVTDHLSSKVWQIREVAARTMCSLLVGRRWEVKLEDLLESFVGADNNGVHGVLMTLELVLKKSKARLLETSLEPALYVAKFLVQPHMNSISGGPAHYIYESTIATLLSIALTSKRSGLLNYDTIIQELESIVAYGDVLDESLTRLTKLQKKGFELLKAAIVRKMLYVAALHDKVLDLEAMLDFFMKEKDTDALCVCVKLMREVWPADVKASTRQLLDVCHLYSFIGCNGDNFEAEIAAGEALASILASIKPEEPFDAVDFSPFHRFCTPDGMNNALRLSGYVMIQNMAHIENAGGINKVIHEWGEIIRQSVCFCEEYATRLASSMALKAFYRPPASGVPRTFTVAELPALEATYDILNDDDDDIREIGAEIIFQMFGLQCSPIKAQQVLLERMVLMFRKETSFVRLVLRRIRGQESEDDEDFEEAAGFKHLLMNALIVDDSLFAEEEHNLYVDEVSEDSKWISVFTYEQGRDWDAAARVLHRFVMSSLRDLELLSVGNDGPYGKTSNPKVFALCAKVIRVASCLIRRYDHAIEEGYDSPKAKDNKCRLEARLHAFVLEGVRVDLHPYLLEASGILSLPPTSPKSPESALSDSPQ